MITIHDLVTAQSHVELSQRVDSYLTERGLENVPEMSFGEMAEHYSDEHEALSRAEARWFELGA